MTSPQKLLDHFQRNLPGKFQEKLVLQLLSLVSVLFLLLICAFCAARQYAQWLMAESTLELGQNNLLLAKSRLEEHFNRLGSLAAVLSYSPTTEQYLMQDSLSRLQSAEDLSAVFANTLLFGRKHPQYLPVSYGHGTDCQLWQGSLYARLAACPSRNAGHRLRLPLRGRPSSVLPLLLSDL